MKGEQVAPGLTEARTAASSVATAQSRFLLALLEEKPVALHELQVEVQRRLISTQRHGATRKTRSLAFESCRQPIPRLTG